MSRAVRGTHERAGRIPATHLRVAGGALLASMAWAITVTGLSFFTAPILDEHPQWKIATFTIYFTIYSLASAFTMPLAAKLIERLGAKWQMMLGGAVAAGGIAIFAGSSELWQFYLGGLVMGIGVGLSIQYIPVILVNRWFVARRGLVLGVVLAGSGVGGALLAVILTPLLGAVGWRSALLVLAGLMLLLTLIPSLFLIINRPSDVGLEAYGAEAESEGEAADVLPGATRAQAMRSPWLYILIASLVLMGVTHGMNQHVVNYLALRPWGIDVSTRFVSKAMLVATVALIFYKPLLGALVDRIGLSKTLIITLSIAAIATFVSAYTTSAPVYLVCVALFSLGFANGTVAPPLIGQAAFGERDFDALWGTLGMAYPIGAAVGVPVWGAVRDVLGSYGWGFISVPLITALFVAGFLASITGGRRLWAHRPSRAIDLDD